MQALPRARLAAALDGLSCPGLGAGASATAAALLRASPSRPQQCCRPPRVCARPQARLEKEAEAVANWNKASSHFKTLADFHAWFYSDHLCYAVPKQHLFGARTIQDERLLASY